MNSLKYFLRGWSVEQIRLKHTWVWKLVLLAPAFVCFMYFLLFYFKGQHFTTVGEQQAWQDFINHTSRTVFTLFLPLFILLFTLLNQQLDHQSNIRKLLYTLPTPQWAQLSAQWLYSLLLYTLTFVWFMVLLLTLGWILSIVRPDLGFEHFASGTIFLAIFNGYLASMGMLALQFVLSYYFRNMVIPLSIGMVGFISAIVLYRWEYIIYSPYSYYMFAYSNTSLSEEGEHPIFIQPVLFGLVVMMVVLILGYIFRKRVRLEN